MSKEKRLARRTKRKSRRAVRREKFQTLLSVFQTDTRATDALDDDNLAYQEKFTKIWPLFSAGLEWGISLRITGKKLDKVLERLNTIGNKMASQPVTSDEEKEFLDLLDKIWWPVELALDGVQIFTGDKVDAVLDRITDIGDWMLDKD